MEIGRFCYDGELHNLFYDKQLRIKNNEITHNKICQVLTEPRYNLYITKKDDCYILTCRKYDDTFASIYMNFCESKYCDSYYKEISLARNMMNFYLMVLGDYVHNIKNSLTLGMMEDKEIKISFNRIMVGNEKMNCHKIKSMIDLNDKIEIFYKKNIYSCVEGDYSCVFGEKVKIIGSSNNKLMAIAKMIHNVMLILKGNFK